MSDAAQKAKAFSESSQALSQRLRFPCPSHSHDALDFPSNMVELSDPALGAHLTYWASMTAYADYKVAILRGTLLKAKAQYEEEFAVRCLSRADKSANHTRLVVSALDVMRALAAVVTDIESDLIVLDALSKGYDRKYQALSREVTRRGNEHGRQIK